MDTNALIDLVYKTYRMVRLYYAFNTVRFPRVGIVYNDYANEKVTKKVTALNLIYNKTKVPVLRNPNAERPTRLIRENISDSNIELFELDFDRIDNRCQGFITTTEYFQYPNSVFGLYNAKNKYIAFKALKALIPKLVNAKYNYYKFKLIYDDLSLLYIGPAQLFGLVPCAWDYEGDKPPKIATWYFKYLEMFIRHKERELSSLLYILLLSGFNDYRATKWAKRKEECNNLEKLKAFAAQKVRELDKYNKALEKREGDKVLVDSGKMIKEVFIINALYYSSSSLFVS
ncbi:hypothetical protein EJ05DRAFT_495010 [Pseudovirgaria hyperparasitica]|uniref:Uncharacterized protein n=1 Tax=Pseudovirgaria hyperparasitica TaxID=470096 RepID=A0A6A6VU52_9PEZI|nr:uncharacterized protein EJ05DRAFT_495010 [Pseudovirgaria hyperparasitica]KAF2753264.1 hypothetical protein EJ05DRAFT_495010 [Pseudovirgaria hyperparasitica]